MNKEIKGTQTERNLIEAFRAEAESATKYLIFAEKIDDCSTLYEKELNKIADNEVEHAEIWLDYLWGTDNNTENLKESVRLETEAGNINYPEWAKVARLEGFDEIASKMEEIGRIEVGHKKIFIDMLENLEAGTVMIKPTQQKWVCDECGYEMMGKFPPEDCPICGHDREHFSIKTTQKF